MKIDFMGKEKEMFSKNKDAAVRHGMIDATEGVIWKQLLRFFYPIALGTLFQLLYNMADAVVVGRFVGKEALAAVGGSASTLITLVVGLFTGLASGATVIIAQFYGARDKEKVSVAVGNAITISLLLGALITVAGIWLAPVALAWMRTPVDTMAQAISYLQICFCAGIPMILYNMGSGILRAVGDSRRPLLYLIVCCFINIGLDILFVAVFKWGVAGAAFATALAQLFSAFLVMFTLFRDDDCYRLRLCNLRPEARTMQSILHIGIPAGFQSCMYALSNIIIMTAINDLNTNFVAAWSAIGKIDSIFWMLISAFGLSLLTVVGQNYGAGNVERVKKSMHSCLLMAFGMTTIIAACMVLFGRPLMLLFVDDALVIDIGMKMMYFFAPSYFAYVCIEIFANSLRGIGDSTVPAIITCVGICVLRVLWVLYLTPFLNFVPAWIAICSSYPASWILTSSAFIIYYPISCRKRGCWRVPPEKLEAVDGI